MGGFGSGRQSNYWRRKVEECNEVDVNLLNRKGCLIPGEQGKVSWFRNEKQDGSIEYWTSEDQITFDYRYRANGGDWQSVSEIVSLFRAPCRFGGTRPYFLCPGVVGGRICARRVTKLYSGGQYFLCRHCYNLSYASQHEGSWERAMRRARKKCERLDDGNIPQRPKGMWWTTYYRLVFEFQKAEREGLLGIRGFLDRGNRS